MKQGDIVLITFPFTNLVSVKVRPALVISKPKFHAKSEDAIFIMITSNINHIRKEEIFLKRGNPNFAATGLKKESVIRIPKIYCLAKILAKRNLGSASPSLLKEVKQKLKDLFF
ncbi:hypothetical protein LCGC14_2259050 [marine sediment metagenome]|uniref:MazF family transcriptional regulator n=1 Tax=marine sediment metagenome TaxID=412755 RepID=A0A0F9D0K6_9ZZZZ